MCNERHQVRLAETCSRLPHAVEVVTIHVSEATAAAACEILVKLNNGAVGAAQELKVVDVISFDGTGKIKSIRACERHLPSNSFLHHSTATLSGSARGPVQHRQGLTLQQQQRGSIRMRGVLLLVLQVEVRLDVARLSTLNGGWARDIRCQLA